LRRREKYFWVVVGVALLIGFLALIPFNAEICEKADNAGHKECASHGFPVYVAFKVQAFLDFLGVAITAVATIAIAWFTLTLRRSTDKLWDAGERQLALLADSSAAQSRDMQASIEAAKTANELNRRNAAADQRPWVTISDMKLNQPFTFVSGGANAGFKFDVKNVGKSPALNVYVHLKLSVRKLGSVQTISEEHDAFRDEFLARKNPGYAVAIFPGDYEEMPISASIMQSEIEESTAITSSGKLIYPIVWVGVSYESAGGEHYHTIAQYMTPGVWRDSVTPLDWPIFHMSSHAV
jgi:hypothetical protein